MGITELLEIDDTIRDMLINGRSSDDIKEYACKENGMLTLWDDAVAKCAAGQMPLEEALRIASKD